MARIICVWGPPCGGKSTTARKMANPGDVIVERDNLHTALTGLPAHQHTSNGMQLANSAFYAILNRAQKLDGRFIFVCGAPTARHREPFTKIGAEMKLVWADRATCQDRATTERPERWSNHIDAWFNQFERDNRIEAGTLI